jgi:DNA-binding winged helix-turn-helix (wHTH) protein/Tfp pilus assembly protein PilF
LGKFLVNAENDRDARRPEIWRIRADASNYVLRHHSEPVSLRPQAFRVLVLLVQRAGTLVTRDELRQAIWPGEIVVDFEHGLNTCIRQVRAALGDQADNPRFVETIPRIGYRFVAAVEQSAVAPELPQGSVRPEEEPAAPSGRWRKTSIARIALAATMAAGLLALAVTVARVERPDSSAESSTGNVEELYTRGRLLLDGWTPGGVRTALGLFEQVVAFDPNHASAHAGIAQAYLQRPAQIAGMDRSVALARRARAVERALALDPDNPEALAALAELHIRRREWAPAGDAFRRALDLQPKSVRIRGQFADWLALQGRFEEAIIEARTAESLDPLSPRARHDVASALRYAGRFEEASAQAQRALDLDPNFGPAHFTLGHAHLALGRLEEAIEEFRRSGRGPTGNLGHALALAGRTAEAREVLHALEQQYAQFHAGEGAIAQVLIGLGENDRALDWIRRSVEAGDGFT